jgi:2-C-methyl-D-erythritol 4-phosphate cytidylyltransferase
VSHGPIDVDVIALGRVVDEGRGSLPYSLVHGEALVAAATWGLTHAQVLPLDPRTSMEGVLDAISWDGLPLVLHDSLCPMTPPEFIAACVRRALDEGVVVVGIARGVDGAGAAGVASPIVVPAGVVTEVGDLLDDADVDFAALTAALEERTPVVTMDGPASAARVADVDDVRALEALTRPPQSEVQRR